ncbi:MAG: hypothetical protein KatS3mg076_0483 [Candidatus Binatia bacterium]|nr:MAG: hypothetical protein KatS3mg076_0483 [Candidatus Binatia bacterium]
MSFFGILDAQGVKVEPVGFAADGTPIYERILGFGFIVVVEGRPGPDGVPVGNSTFRHVPGDPLTRPDLQIVADRPLGNGSPAVCDNDPPDNFGGVPAVSPPSFAPTQTITDAINDFACRFVNGRGEPVGRPASEACVLHPDGEFRFVNPLSRVQFCATIAKPLQFPRGDTLLVVRLRNVAGQTGPEARLILRSQS